MSFPTTPCDACAAPIILATTASGAPMPVDAEPAAGANIELRARAGAPVGYPVRTARRIGRVDLRHRHATTCAQLAAVRAGRKRPAR